MHLVQGDVRHTRAQSILLGLNARGQVDVNPLETALRDQYPVFYSDYRRRNLTSGDLWFFHESKPKIIGAVIRDSASGATKLRYLEHALLLLRQQWQLEGVTSLAIAPLGTSEEWPDLKTLLAEHLRLMNLPVVVYDAYVANQPADESAIFPD